MKTQLNSFSRTGTRLWNSIPNSFRDSNKPAFKKKDEKYTYFEIEKAIQLFQDYCKLAESTV